MNTSDARGTAMSAFLHAALIVDSDLALRERLLPSLRRSLEAGDQVLMVVGAHTERVVRTLLGTAAEALEWGDTGAFYQRLGFTFSAFRDYLAGRHAAGVRVHVVAEPDIPTSTAPDAPIDRVAAYLSYEALCNHAYAAYGCPVTCLWDSRRHPALVIEGVRSLHPYELTAAGPEANAEHVTTAEYLAGRNLIALEPPPAAVDLDLTLTDVVELRGLRAELRAWARGHGFGDAATDDVITAAGAIATNGLQHGAPPVRVRAWQVARTLIVQVDDSGGIPLPAFGGYQPPTPGQHRGRGLWLARQLADAVTTHTDTHTHVRLHFPHDLTHRDVD